MTAPGAEPRSVEDFNAAGEPHLPGMFGLVVTFASDEVMRGRLELGPQHLAANGFLHAATVVALADTLCGCGTLRSRPAGSTGFTTVEVKANYLGTARDGAITCEARRVHAGRTTQVWDAEVASEATGKAIALFRCTQIILWPVAP